MVNLPLSEVEADYLKDILSMWIEGHDEAEALTIDDPMHTTADDLLDAVGGLVEQKQAAQCVLDRLQGELNGV